MSVCKMEKLTVVCRIKDADAIVRRLMRLRAVSLTKRSEASPAASLDGFSPHADVAGATARLARVEAVLPVLQKRSTRKKGLFPAPLTASAEEFLADGRYATAWRVVEEAEKILQTQGEMRAEANALRTRLDTYRPYLTLKEPLGFTGTETTCFLLGCLPAGTRHERVLEALSGLAAHVTPISEDSAGVYISLLVHRSAKDAALRALSGLGFVKAPFSGEAQRAAELFDRCREELWELEEALKRLDARLTALAEKLDLVEILSDVERTTLLAEENKSELAKTKECAVLVGWCPAKRREQIGAVLDEFHAAYELEEPAEGEEPPILLKNNAFSRNFEWVLGMYAYPKYGTLDPTFVMSIFYFLIFGIMFADAGYGLVMSAVCFAAVRWLHPRESMKRFLLMFGYCGISCIIFGVLLGSYFGNFPLAFMESMMGMAPEELPRLSILPAEAANVAVLFDPI